MEFQLQGIPEEAATVPLVQYMNGLHSGSVVGLHCRAHAAVQAGRLGSAVSNDVACFVVQAL